MKGMKKSVIFILLIAGFAWSCKKNSDTTSPPDVTPPSEQNVVLKNITTGTFTEVSNSTVGMSGSTVKISKPNTPADGVEIAIPANAYSSNPTLKISYAEIKSHQFGANFNPISPFISISCDGGYSKELMMVTIPVKIPQGHIPLGFYLDETTGKLEGIPVKSVTANSITLLTRHFSPASQLKSGDLKLKAGTANNAANIVISSISESVLNLQPIISSGFKPGVDDWEFANRGSYIAPGGHCAGQNMAAMWYYFERKTAEGSLFNKFSDNANLWQDNARGYRFCSVIHGDLEWEGTVVSLFGKYIDKNQELDKLKLLTIAGTMLVTGEPQGIGIYKQTGLKNDGTPAYGGHDLICYQVSVSSGKLFISDPNYPGEARNIDFDGIRFKPYSSKPNADGISVEYNFVTYYAKTAYIEWNKIGKRFDEMKNSTIGTVSPNKFPAYAIWGNDGKKDFEVKDGMTITQDTLRTIIQCADVEDSECYYEYLNGSLRSVLAAEVFDENGKKISIQVGKKDINYTLNSKLYVKLKSGLNKLGYYVQGWRTAAKYANTEIRIPRYIDFKWINVNCVPLTIVADPVQGKVDKEVKFTARTVGATLKSAKYIWDFGDGSASVTKTNDSIATHIFVKTGKYNVKVELFDGSNNAKIGDVTIPYDVNNGVIPFDISYVVEKKSFRSTNIYRFKVNVKGTAEGTNKNSVDSVAQRNGGTKIYIKTCGEGGTKINFKYTVSVEKAVLETIYYVLEKHVDYITVKPELKWYSGGFYTITHTGDSGIYEFLSCADNIKSTIYYDQKFELYTRNSANDTNFKLLETLYQNNSYCDIGFIDVVKL